MSKIIIPYKPRPFQAQIHQKLDNHRWNVLVMHRRFGKTVMLINQLVKSSMICSLTAPRFHYCAPYLKQAKKIAWDYVKRYTNMIPNVQYNESELRCDFPNGARLVLIGADNAEGHRGIYSDGTVFDEYGNTDPSVFTSIFRPALSDRGGWAVFAGTPNGRNHFHELLCRAEEDTTGTWFGKVMRASETGVLSKEELDDARFIMSEEEYEREYECSFVSGARGAYYAKQLRKAEADGRITSIPHITEHEVYTFWDLGMDDSTSIWFMQNIGKEIRFIDYYENNGQGMDHYAKILKEKQYNYGDHFMPHDANHRSGQTGKTMKQYAETMGIKPIIVVERAKDSVAVKAHIEAGRNILSQCYFDKQKCSRGLSALESYQTEWDESKQKLGDRPLHDWTSHAADAFRTFAVGYRAPTKIKTVEQIMGKVNYSGVW
jgi:phage terminase large subunit